MVISWMTTDDAKQKKKKLLLQQQLKALKSFSNTKAVRKLKEELETKLRQLERKAATEAQARPRQTKLPISKAVIRRLANDKRSAKLRKYHNYLRQIRDNYPDLTYADLRKQFRERKEGKHTKVPDVIWRNPSP